MENSNKFAKFAPLALGLMVAVFFIAMILITKSQVPSVRDPNNPATPIPRKDTLSWHDAGRPPRKQPLYLSSVQVDSLMNIFALRKARYEQFVTEAEADYAVVSAMLGR